MKLMILGGSNAQLIAIKKAQAMGIQVVTCDYLLDAVGHKYSDFSCYKSTFDLEGALEKAREHQIDGIMTLGTDQPVLTVAYVASRMGLPQLIDYEAALLVTNKRYMKKRFVDDKIPTVAYLLFQESDALNKLENFHFPVVVKPVDSQGQRGIYYLENHKQVYEKAPQVLAHSRENQFLVERYYPHEEVTVSGWVKDQKVYVLSITDRITFGEKEQIGICLAHTFPSKHMTKHGQELVGLTEKIAENFKITEGPIYFQYLIGEEGIKVNEIACRIGGAYEATFIPFLTGFDICEAMIYGALGLDYNLEILKDYNVLTCKKQVSVQLFFVKPCRIHYMPTVDEIKNLPGVVEVGFHVHKGDTILEISNATSRGGYVVLESNDPVTMKQCIEKLYQVLIILDENRVNHLIHEEIY